jgi:hypothetical protein
LKVQFTLERPLNVVDFVFVVALELDDAKGEIIQLVRQAQDFITRFGDGAAPAARPLTSLNRSRPVPGMRLSMS